MGSPSTWGANEGAQRHYDRMVQPCDSHEDTGAALIVHGAANHPTLQHSVTKQEVQYVLRRRSEDVSDTKANYLTGGAHTEQSARCVPTHLVAFLLAPRFESSSVARACRQATARLQVAAELHGRMHLVSAAHLL